MIPSSGWVIVHVVLEFQSSCVGCAVVGLGNRSSEFCRQVMWALFLLCAANENMSVSINVLAEWGDMDALKFGCEENCKIILQRGESAILKFTFSPDYFMHRPKQSKVLQNRMRQEKCVSYICAPREIYEHRSCKCRI